MAATVLTTGTIPNTGQSSTTLVSPRGWQEALGPVKKRSLIRVDNTRLEEQAEGIKAATERALDTHVEQIRICLVSKQWWSEGKAREWWHKERTGQSWEEYRKRRNSPTAAIREARKERWESSLGVAKARTSGPSSDSPSPCHPSRTQPDTRRRRGRAGPER